MRNYEIELEEAIEAQGGTAYSPAGLVQQYQRGLSDGLEALDSSQLKQIVKTVLSNRNSSPLIARFFALENQRVHPLVSYRTGYTDGVEEFAKNAKLHKTGVGQDTLVNPISFDVLAQDEVILGFARGLRRDKPAIDPGYFQPDDASKITFDNSVVQLDLHKVLAAMPYRTGYGLGFRVGVVRDFDVALNNSQVPKDDLTYEAFLVGLVAQEAPVDLWHAPLLSHQRKVVSSYLGGLEVWLRNQGVVTSEIKDINYMLRLVMTPSGLEAFKRGLDSGEKPYWSNDTAGVDRSIWPHFLNLFMAYDEGSKARQSKLQVAS